MGSQSGSKIVKKVWINASREVIYSALTEPRELIHWFCDRSSCDAREGGEFTAYWRLQDQKGRGVFTRVVPGSELELLWTEDGRNAGEPGARHILSYEIRSKSGLTELIMTDQETPALDEESAHVLDQGWNLVLQDLKEHCERKQRSAKARPRLSRSQSGAK